MASRVVDENRIASGPHVDVMLIDLQRLVALGDLRPGCGRDDRRSAYGDRDAGRRDDVDDKGEEHAVGPSLHWSPNPRSMAGGARLRPSRCNVRPSTLDNQSGQSHVIGVGMIFDPITILMRLVWRDDLDERAATIRMRKDCRGATGLPGLIVAGKAYVCG